MSVAEKLQMQRELDEYRNKTTVELPDDFTTCIPSEGLAWPLSYGISEDVCKDYGFGWSDKLKRFVMPIYDVGTGRLLAVQSRAINGVKPKYLNRGKALMWSNCPPSLDYIVVTEDILSMVKVGFNAPSASTLGTYMSQSYAVDLLRSYDTVYVWYDGDDAGIKGAKQAKRELKMLGASVQVISTDKDPKEYTNREIKDILNDML